MVQCHARDVFVKTHDISHRVCSINLHLSFHLDDMSQGRREAFEVFRADYPHNLNIEENKRTLKQR